jgi:hypothetical protein
MYARSRGVSDPRDGPGAATGVQEGGRSRPGCYRYSQSRAAKNAARRLGVRRYASPQVQQGVEVASVVSIAAYWH